MSKSTTLPQTSTVDDQRAEPPARQLFLVRCLWLLSAPVLIALTCFFLPLQVSLVQTVCTSDNCSSFQPNPGTLHDLEQLGLSLNAATVIIVSIIGACALTWFVIAVIIARKNFSNWFALSVSLLALIQMAMAARPPDLLHSQATATPWLWVVIAILIALDDTIYVIVGTLFPNGRLTPRWTRLILLSWLVIGLPCNLLANLPSPLPLEWQNWLGIVSSYCWLLCIAAIIVAQIYRYRRLYRPVERQQTKWVLFFGGIALLEQATGESLSLIFPALFAPGSLYSLFYYPITKLFLTLLGLSLLFAMLRYRLWDIGRIINRTLVYGSLTGLLALVYFGLVIALQSVVHVLTGQVSQTPVVIVASTLAIAALFQPLRHRIQAIIDRRFYRRKYDAAKTLEAFSATLRNEVDLSQLSEHLITVVQETMQPTHISLWLLPAEQKNRPDRQMDEVSFKPSFDVDSRHSKKPPPTEE
jgi:hypothetical protein